VDDEIEGLECKSFLPHVVDHSFLGTTVTNCPSLHFKNRKAAFQHFSPWTSGNYVTIPSNLPAGLSPPAVFLFCAPDYSRISTDAVLFFPFFPVNPVKQSFCGCGVLLRPPAPPPVSQHKIAGFFFSASVFFAEVSFSRLPDSIAMSRFLFSYATLFFSFFPSRSLISCPNQVQRMGLPS